MTENEKLRKALGEVTNCYDHGASKADENGDVFVHGWIPKDAWATIKAAAGEGDKPVTTGGADSTVAALEARLAALEKRLDASLSDDGKVEQICSAFLQNNYPNCKPSYDALLKRVEHIEDEGAFQNNVEFALVRIIEESYKTPDEFSAFHSRVHALLKYHFGKLARSQS